MALDTSGPCRDGMGGDEIVIREVHCMVAGKALINQKFFRLEQEFTNVGESIGVAPIFTNVSLKDMKNFFFYYVQRGFHRPYTFLIFLPCGMSPCRSSSS